MGQTMSKYCPLFTPTADILGGLRFGFVEMRQARLLSITTHYAKPDSPSSLGQKSFLKYASL
jgi:hypothetical protein